MHMACKGVFQQNRPLVLGGHRQLRRIQTTAPTHQYRCHRLPSLWALTGSKPTNLNYVQAVSSSVCGGALLAPAVSCLTFARPCGGVSSSRSRASVDICAHWQACGALPVRAGLHGKPAAPAGRNSISAPSETSRERHVPLVRSGLPHASRLHPAMRRKPVGEIAHLIGDDMATGKNEVLESTRLIRDV